MNQSPQVVIVSTIDDPHIPYVTEHLRVPYVVIDPAQLLKKVELSYAVEDGRLRVSYDGADLSQVRAVWYRKPEDFTPESLPIAAAYKQYVSSGLQEHWRIIRSLFSDALWMSDYYQLERVSSKPLQLQIAGEVGFRVPATVMTSSPDVARSFIKTHKSVITKPLSRYGFGASDDDSKVFLTTKVNADTALEGLHLAPAVFQQAIEAAVDIRVNVVGEKVFAATIEGSAIDKKGSDVRDWKVAHFEGDMRITAYDLPDDIAALCVKHVQALGVRFGAIDLIKDTQNRYWFIENNTNGQWAFIVEATGQPVGRAIAELLMSGQ